MDEDIEGLWIDREMHSIQGSVFDDVMLASSEAIDIALDHAECEPHAAGFVSRVVAIDPSDRLLRTADYFNVGTVLRIEDGVRELVLGPAMCVDEVGADAAAAASEVYADVMRIVFGDQDGTFVVRSMPPSLASIGARPWLEAA